MIQKIYEKAELIKKYKSFLPICANCKVIKDDKSKELTKEIGNLRKNITEKQQTDFSHGICPSCAEKIYPSVRINKK